MTTTILTAATFGEAISANDTVIVDVWAPWCALDMDAIQSDLATQEALA